MIAACVVARQRRHRIRLIACSNPSRASYRVFAANANTLLFLHIQFHPRRYTTVAGSCVAISFTVGVTCFVMVRVALARERMNSQAAAIATPAKEIHIIQSATVTFVLLVNAAAKPAR